MKSIYALMGAAALILAPIAAHADTLRWSGDVDDTAIVHINRDRVWTTDNKNGVHNEHSRIEGQFHGMRDRVSIAKYEGRGDVRVVEQPNRRNHFTAAVRIHDPQGGASHYKFMLVW